MSAETQHKRFVEYNAALLKQIHILQYLTETRELRRKGNKLAPEKILWDAMIRKADGLR